jgi:hypothetical protein
MGLSAFQYFGFPNQEIFPKMKKKISVDREFHALSDYNYRFFLRVDLHVQNLILVRITGKNGKSEIK